MACPLISLDRDQLDFDQCALHITFILLVIILFPYSIKYIQFRIFINRQAGSKTLPTTNLNGNTVPLLDANITQNDEIASTEAPPLSAIPLYPVDPDFNEQEEKEKLESQESHLPWLKLISSCIIFIIHSFLVILSHNHRDAITWVPEIKTCSATYWILISMIVFSFTILGLGIACLTYKRHLDKVRVNFVFTNGDILWNINRLIIVIMTSIFAGIASSLLGIGGGIVLTPVFLELGIPNDCTSATSSIIIVFTAGSSVIQYLSLYPLPLGYMIYFALLCSISSAIGQILLRHLIKKYNSQVFILLATLLMCLGSAALLTYMVVERTMIAIQSGSGLGIKDMC